MHHALHHAHQQRRREALAGDIAEHERDLVIAGLEGIVEIAADLPRGHTSGGKLDISRQQAARRKQIELDLPRHRQLLFDLFASQVMPESKTDNDHCAKQREGGRDDQNQVFAQGAEAGRHAVRIDPDFDRAKHHGGSRAARGSRPDADGAESMRTAPTGVLLIAGWRSRSRTSVCSSPGL